MHNIIQTRVQNRFSLTQPTYIIKCRCIIQKFVKMGIRLLRLNKSRVDLGIFFRFTQNQSVRKYISDKVSAKKDKFLFNSEQKFCSDQLVDNLIGDETVISTPNTVMSAKCPNFLLSPCEVPIQSISIPILSIYRVYQFQY